VSFFLLIPTSSKKFAAKEINPYANKALYNQVDMLSSSGKSAIVTATAPIPTVRYVCKNDLVIFPLIYSAFMSILLKTVTRLNHLIYYSYLTLRNDMQINH
jgi:hypothetical protein